MHRQRRPASGALSLAAALALGGAALEALDAAAGVHELLLARVEGVAVGADLHVQVTLGRARLERVPARAGHGCLDVFRMDLGLHDEIQCRWPYTSGISAKARPWSCSIRVPGSTARYS